MVDVLDNTTNAVFIPTIISRMALQNFKSYLNLTRTISRNSDWTTATEGEVLRIPFLGTLTANDKTSGSNFTKQKPTSTDVFVTLDQHKEVTIAIDDVTKVLENQDTLMRYANEAARALAEVIESGIAGLHPSLTNTITWDNSSATTIDTSMLAIRKFFTDQKVPRNEQRQFYADPTVINDILGVDKFTRDDARGSNPAIREGNVIRTYGIETWESQEIQTSGSPVAYHNLAYTKNALILATRPLPQPVGFGGVSTIINDPDIGMSFRALFHYDPDLGAHVLTLDVLYGFAILDQRRIVEVEST